MPVHSIATVIENGNGEAILQTADHSFYHPLCGGLARSIKTSIPYEDVIDMLDGKMKDVGSVAMAYYQDTIE